MANIMDYLSWRGDLSFAKDRVNEVDIVILSQIVMLDLSKSVPKRGSIALKDSVERYLKTTPKDKHLGFIIPKSIGDLFVKMGESERFASLELSRYVEDIDVKVETQFSALTVEAKNIKTRFVIFSGTDDTIVGWKENFNLVYKTPTEAQRQSVNYLNDAAKGYEGKIIVLGHSKGGHLALYSSANCDDKISQRIKRIYNLDGPGIPEGEDAERLFAKIEKKILALLPQSSVIGRLFEHGGEHAIVHSTANGLFQHDCFSWQVQGKGLVYEEEFCEVSSRVDTGVRNILASMDVTERENFIESIFGLFSSAGCATLTDLAINTKAVVKAYFKLDRARRNYINHTAVKFLRDKYLRRCIMETTKDLNKYANKPTKRIDG